MERPALHALLNGTAFVLLLGGWCAIRGWGPWSGGRREDVHQRFMLGALAVSAVFLASYLQYHYQVGHVPFWGEGTLKTVYLLVLLPHILLAVVNLPMIVVVVVAALRGRLDRHRRWARWALPIWLYVSISGVAVYVMNFALRPAGG